MRKRPEERHWGLDLGGRAARVFLAAALVMSMSPIPSTAAFAADAQGEDTTESQAAKQEETASSTDATDDAEATGSNGAGATASADKATTTETSTSRPSPRRAPAAKATVYVDGNSGSDGNDGASAATAVKTIKRALEIQAANSSVKTISIKGAIALAASVAIPSGVTLHIDAAGATVTGGGNNGITLKAGSTLTGNGTLAMTGFNTALTSEAGSTITDGTYVFKDNAGRSGSHGIYLAGTVKGSSGKDKLTIKADDKSNTDFYASDITFENCTVSVNSQARTWFDARDLNLKNASLTVKGFGQTFYVNKLNMDGSDLTINPSSYGGTGMTIQGASSIVNSKITANAGSTAGISVGVGSNTVSVTNSTLEFTNGGTGGLNVNNGKVVLTNSTIRGDGRNSGALFGAQKSGSIEFGENCLVETPKKSDADNGTVQNGGSFVVSGGSYMVKYAPDYNSGYGSTIPTNGANNGDEKLSLFTLANAATTTLSPLNANGTAYTYSVAKASSDGAKHVWVPAAKVTFKLNADDSTQQVSASFADGTSADKTSLAMRGYALSVASSVEGGTTAIPDDPFAPGYKFAGWYYKDANGSEHAFTKDEKITADTTVYAKWESDASTYAIRYHNGADDDVTYFSTSSDPSRKLTVLSGDDVMKANPSFAREGKTFKGWTTKPDGEGDTVKAGSSLAVPTDTSVVDLYAEWEDQTVTVRFSANGGTFSKDSVFRKNPDVFDIQTDANGGEVAVVKAQAKVSDHVTLDALLKSLGDGSVNASAKGIANPTSSNNDAAYTGIATYKYHVLDYKDVKRTVWFWTVDDDYYWFDDATGTSEAKIDGNAKLTKDVTYYLKWNDDPNVEKVTQKKTIPADMWSGSQDDTSSVKDVNTSETFSLTGAVDATGIVDQMNSFESSIAGGLDDLTKISLSETKSTFTATLTLPEGVKVPKDPKVTVSGLGDCFEVTDTSVDGQKVSVTFSLKGTYENYKQLKDAVESTGKDDAPTTALPKPIEVTVDGLTLDTAKVDNGQELTATGTVSGTFSSYAENTVTGKVKKYDLAWTGEQVEASADPRGTGIQQTILVVKPYDQKLPADMLVGENTEHDEVIELSQGSTFDLTGTILAASIQEQMDKIETAYPNTDHDNIKLDGLRFSFEANFTVPDGMMLPADLDAGKVTVSDFGSGFKVSDVQVSGKTVTVTFSLSDPDSIKTYSDLEKVVDAAGATDGWMRVTVPGITVDKDAAVGENLTIVGAVKGSFSANAVSAGGTRKVFSFIWTGTQWPDGKDAVATDDETIQLTARPTKAAEPVEPEPVTPKPSKPKSGKSSSPSGSTAKQAKVPYTGDSLPSAFTLLAVAGLGVVAIAIGLRARRKSK